MHPLRRIKKFLHKTSVTAKQEINKNPHLGWLKKFRHKNFWHLNRYSVAAGIASGVFAAFIPLPIQMLCAAMIAIMVRGNILLAIAATWITNPFTFIPINVFLFKVGTLATNTPSVNPSEITYVDFEWANLLETLERFWLWLQKMGKPFLVGTLIVSISVSSTVFILIYGLWGLIGMHRHFR